MTDHADAGRDPMGTDTGGMGADTGMGASTGASTSTSMGTNIIVGDETIARFLDGVAAGAPVPGGGAVAALAAAAGAALVVMVCNLTIGREAYRAHEQTMIAARARAEEKRRQALALATDDTAAYRAVGAAYRLPRATVAEQATRAARVEDALKGATDIPLRTVALAARVVELCAEVMEGANPNALGDLGVGALSARAALDGAALNVRINLALIHDDAFTSTASAELRRLLDSARPRADALMQAVTVKTTTEASASNAAGVSKSVDE